MKRSAAVVAMFFALLSRSAEASKLTLGPYLQDLRSDGFVVVSETNAAAQVEVVVRDAADEIVARTSSPGTWHETTIRGLQPATEYRYRVTVDGVDFEGGSAHTAPDGGAPFSFIVYGDSRDGRDTEARIAHSALESGAELVLHTGDIVREGGLDEDWRGFFKATAPMMANIPLYPTLGNHEIYEDATASHFLHYFVLPENGRTLRYYTFRYASARFFVLDGNRVDEETRASDNHVLSAQTAWLTGAVEAATHEAGVDHFFALVHQPPFSNGGHCGAAEREAEWVAIFEKYRFSAVFGGHDHAYQRLERNGVRYFDSGGGGAEIYPEEHCTEADRAARRSYVTAKHYLRVRVAGDSVEVAALGIDETPIETTLIHTHDPATTDSTPLHDNRVLPGMYRPAAAAFAIFALVGGLLWRRRRFRG